MRGLEGGKIEEKYNPSTIFRTYGAGWDKIAGQTIEVYRKALARRVAGSREQEEKKLKAQSSKKDRLAADARGRRRHSKAEIKRMVFNLPEGHDNHCGDSSSPQ